LIEPLAVEHKSKVTHLMQTNLRSKVPALFVNKLNNDRPMLLRDLALLVETEKKKRANGVFSALFSI